MNVSLVYLGLARDDISVVMSRHGVLKVSIYGLQISSMAMLHSSLIEPSSGKSISSQL